MTMLDLPGDLLEEILYRVPAISLGKLRFTCKRCNNLFSNRRFARKHFHKAPKQNLTLMLTTKKVRVCSMSTDLHGIPSIEEKGEISLSDFQFKINIKTIFHYDGLLLCTIREDPRILVWNPCTGQTRWIQPSDSYKTDDIYCFSLGSYQDDKSGNTSYKVLSYTGYSDNLKFKIYEINSNSYRILDVTPACYLIWHPVSLKGKTYWLGWDKNEEQLGVFLVSFDYTTERFERLLLPFQCRSGSYQTVAQSSVREEKLSVLLHRNNPWGIEIWVTNKIDETKVVISWSKVLTVDCPEREGPIRLNCFLVDEEKKKIIMCYEKGRFDRNAENKNLVYIVGEDNKVTQVDFRDDAMDLLWPDILSYVPSLVQIDDRAGGKRKRGD